MNLKLLLLVLHNGKEFIVTSRTKQDIWKSFRYMNMVDFDLPIINDNIPSTYKAAIHIPENGDQWKKSMGGEINSLYKNQTWDSVPLPKGEKEIGCKWVYSKKEWPMSKDDIRFKARLVTKGYVLYRKSAIIGL